MKTLFPRYTDDVSPLRQLQERVMRCHCLSFFLLVCLSVIHVSCRAGTAVLFTSSEVRSELPAFEEHARPASEAYRAYLHCYGFDTLDVSILAGTFVSDSFVCVGQLFIPKASHGTVFFQHGLFDHTGIIANGIRLCLKEGFTVAASDMPGHGLSGGEQAGVSSFDEYVKAFSRFYDLCRPVVDSPYIYIGHSTGCALGYEYATTLSVQPFSRIIFLAPLARSAMYHLSLAGNAVMSPFSKSTMRWFREQSHDKAFLKRLHNDPLQAKRLPLRWAKAYFRWWRTVRDRPQRTLPLTVIQGTADGVVDWKYNLPFYRRKVPGVEIVEIKGARHQLLNETPEYRSACTSAIVSCLSRFR